MNTIDLAGLASSDSRIKYGCAKNVLAIARENPAAIYPHLEEFKKLLDSENRILKWTAIDTIGYLARVDASGKIDGLVGRIVGLLSAGNLITANHAISALTDIALAKPEYQETITKELLKVEHYSYDTDECRNIAIGKVILALTRYVGQIRDKEAVIEFARRQTTNSRNATRKKAEQFLRRYGQKD